MANRKKNKGIKIGTFQRDGHKSHTCWSRMLHDSSIQDLLKEEIKKWNKKYSKIKSD